MRVTPKRIRTKEQRLRRAEIAAQQGFSAMTWAWFALACCAGDAFTALGVLILKALVWPAIRPMSHDEKEDLK